MNILLSLAQFERELAGERIRDRFAASRRNGIFMRGHPRLGYDVHDRELVVNPAEDELIRLIFRRFLDLGSALLLIRELNAEGRRTKSWTKLHRTTPALDSRGVQKPRFGSYRCAPWGAIHQEEPARRRWRYTAAHDVRQTTRSRP